MLLIIASLNIAYKHSPGYISRNVHILCKTTVSKPPRTRSSCTRKSP